MSSTIPLNPSDRHHIEWIWHSDGTPAHNTALLYIDTVQVPIVVDGTSDVLNISDMGDIWANSNQAIVGGTDYSGTMYFAYLISGERDPADVVAFYDERAA